jgi:hypothetical protein
MAISLLAAAKSLTNQAPTFFTCVAGIPCVQ